MTIKLKKLSRTIRSPYNKWKAFKKLKNFHSKERNIEEIVVAGMNLGTAGNYRVDSVQKKTEILALVSRVAELNPSNILEIGTCNGGTLFMWANIAASKVVTCDLYKNDVREEFYDKFPPPNSLCKVCALTGNTHESNFRKSVFKEFNNEKIDFLFIDGDHTEKGVENDFYDYKDLVRKGGIIAFHDILKKQPVATNQVYNFWERIKCKYEYEEYIHDPEQTGFGIGILYV